MIKFSDNKNDIVSLWRDAFGDSEEDILFFIENAKNAQCLMSFDGEKAVSMLYLVDCFISGRKGKYIYAACTSKAYEGRGEMSALLEHSKVLGYGFICLIPANERLIDYYKKRGFSKTEKVESTVFEQIPEINEYLFEGCELVEPLVLICEV